MLCRDGEKSFSWIFTTDTLCLGKSIFAADETLRSLTRRLDALKIESTPDSRRAYREMFLTIPGIAEFISGVIYKMRHSA